jgi:hypothetical protein
LAAGDWILGAGLIDLWRQPKSYAYDATKAANQPRILAIRMTPRNVYASRGSNLEVIGINERDALTTLLSIRIISRSGETVFSKDVRTEWNKGVSTLLSQRIDAGSLRGEYTVTVTVSAEDGSIVTENESTIDVFHEQDLVPPKTRIAVLDLDGPFTRFLKQQGIDAMDFDASTPQSAPVFVTRVTPKSPSEQKRFAELMTFIREGGTAVYVQGLGRYYQRDASNQVRSPTIPFAARVEAAQGLWTCIPHLVRNHPIFAGLPADGMMRDIYENVWARQTLRDLDAEPLVASIGFKWFSEDHKLHYSGPGESWWGADLAIVPHGQGRIVVSQLRIVENLGKDPVADKLLYNLIGSLAH